jgi:hypothetical protein
MISAALIATTTTVAAQADTLIPQLVIGPPGDSIRELFDHPNEWSRTRARTGAILCTDHILAHFSDEELRKWFGLMRSWGISLELEVGAIKEWGPSAEDTFRAEKPIWDRAVRLGADIKSIAMDEPLVASRAMLHRPDDYAVVQTAQFVSLVRNSYPAIRIGDIEPYPAIPLGDHVSWVNQLQERLQQQHVRSLDFYRLDVDWVSFAKTGRGNWRDVSSLVTTLRTAHLPVSMIYWASGYPSEKAEGIAGNDTWYVEVLGQGYDVADAGIAPDQFVVESWIEAPDRIVPENQEFTFTRSVLDLARKHNVPSKGNIPRL